MSNGQNTFLAVIFLGLTALGVMMASPSYAGQVITFGPHDTKIEGSIRYTVIGRYVAHFNSFRGRILLGKNPQQVQSVYLEIQSRSILSRHPWCDRIARSRRLLYAARYPEIIFKSDKIFRDESGYKVKGVLEMHGIKKTMIFPFEAGIIIDPKTKCKFLDLKGRWSMDRKDFHINWNKYLDHGGILVSDNFVVKWGIRVQVQL